MTIDINAVLYRCIFHKFCSLHKNLLYQELMSCLEKPSQPAPTV